MANFTLEMIYPKAVGVVPTGLDATNRCFFAYPGLTYSIQICAIGGDYPYTYELDNEPAGMTVDADTGVVTWTTPQAGTHSDIVFRVRDAEDATDEETLSIVCGTSGWKFVDASAPDDTGDGTIGDPYQTIDNVYDSSGANSRVYFRAGTYPFTGVPITTGGTNADNRMVFSSSARSTCWLAYPGDAQPVIDFASDHTDLDDTPALRPGGPAIYFDGLKFQDGFNKTLWIDRTNRRGIHLRNCTFDGLGPGGTYGGGDNTAAVMFTQLYGGGGVPDTQAYGDVIYGCTFTDFRAASADETSSPVGVKQYSWWKGLVHGCTFDAHIGRECGAQKSDDTQVTWRANTFNNSTLGGNFNNVQDKCSAEICFNYFNRNDGGNGLHMWPSKGTADADEVFIYRNTFRCGVLIDHLYTADGPYAFTNNVFVNADGAGSPWNYLQDSTISDNTRVSITTSATPTGTENLAGAAGDGIIDASGLLQGAFRTSYLGSWGHEIEAAAEPPTHVGSAPVFAMVML
jgi:hypothetical protein